MSRSLSAALLVAIVASGCISTRHVLLAPARAPIAASAVRVYQVPPRRSQEIARLDASSAVGFGTQGQTNAAINRLVREAAKLGANGVLLLGVDTTASPVGMGIGTGVVRSHVGVFGSVGIPTVQRHAAGVAIHVIED